MHKGSTKNNNNKDSIIKIDLSTIYFSMFFAWLLAVPFFGQVLNGRMEELQVNPSTAMVYLPLIMQFIGLISSGYLVKTTEGAKNIIPIAVLICIPGTLVFLFPYSILWDVCILIMSFVGGAVVASWGSFYQGYATSRMKLQAAANIIIYSNIGMILLNTIAVTISSTAGLLMSVLMLAGSLILCIRWKLPGKYIKEEKDRPFVSNKKETSLFRPLALLYIFIAIITINSCLMYQTVNPAFSHHGILTGVYWAIPYIGAILILKKLPERINKSYILYIALTMIGFAYILFFILDNSALSYIIIDTIMLGAFGICDLFWWVIIGEMLAFTDRPMRIFGIGLSANILGVIIGGLIGESLPRLKFGGVDPIIIAVGIVFISLMVLPILYVNLSKIIKDQNFLMDIHKQTTYNAYERKQEPVHESTQESLKEALTDYMKTYELTERQIEIAGHLLKGETYKMIADGLHISENTVKTHIRNIYAKLEVSSKTEFLMKIKEKS